MRCLVTGASGFVGSHLVHSLVNSGMGVLAVVRESSDLWRLRAVEQKIEIAYSDIQNISSIERQIQAFRPDAVFHLAWTGGNSRAFLNDESQIFMNLPGSLELVRIAQTAGCKTYVFVGSCLEYGRYSIPVRETDPVAPTSLYGLSKSSTLHLSAGLCSKYAMRFVGARLFWAYGPMDDELRMIPSVIRNLLEGRRPALTPGEQIWDFLYISDVVSALTALACSESAEGVFNIGSGIPVSVKEVVMKIRDQVNPSLELGFGDVPYAPGQVMHLQADVGRLSSATGWKSQVSLEEGIRRTIDWYGNRKDAHGR